MSVVITVRGNRGYGAKRASRCVRAVRLWPVVLSSWRPDMTVSSSSEAKTGGVCVPWPARFDAMLTTRVPGLQNTVLNIAAPLKPDDHLGLRKSWTGRRSGLGSKLAKPRAAESCGHGCFVDQPASPRGVAGRGRSRVKFWPRFPRCRPAPAPARPAQKSRCGATKNPSSTGSQMDFVNRKLRNTYAAGCHRP